MPLKVVHPGIGFVEFKPTDEDLALVDLQEKNKELQSKVSELEDKLNKLLDSLNTTNNKNT